MGKGGLVAQPVAPPPASKGKIILSGGNWELQRASEVTASGEENIYSGLQARELDRGGQCRERY